MTFDLHIGIDYSGRETPTSRTPALQVYAAFDTEEPRRILWPSSTEKTYKNWCRKEIAEWLIEQAQKNITFIAGIDHRFSFPISYFERYKLTSWPQFLDDFCQHWPTDDDHTYVDFIRDRDEGPPDRTGDPSELRLTEKWTSSAKSVFKFDVQGSVAKSTHAGIPWLRRIREEVGDKVHFWPFDGWEGPERKSVIAEIYPSIFKTIGFLVKVTLPTSRTPTVWLGGWLRRMNVTSWSVLPAVADGGGAGYCRSGRLDLGDHVMKKIRGYVVNIEVAPCVPQRYPV